MNARIIGVAGPFQDMVYVLPNGEISLGRDPSNEMSAMDASLSRRHCVLIRTGSSLIVRDLNSRNGTRVNGVPIDEQFLRHGDQISIGASLLVYLVEDESEEGDTATQQVAETTEFKGLAALFAEVDEQPAKTAEESGRSSAERGAGDSRHLKALLQLATAIGRIREIESLQWQLLGFVFDIVPAERGAILSFDPAHDAEPAATWDRQQGPAHPVPPKPEAVKRVLRDRQTYFEITPAGPKAKSTTKTVRRGTSAPPEPPVKNTYTLICVPLVTPEKVLGAIYLEADAEKPFEDHHLQILMAVADIAALAIQNLRYWEQLAQENQTLRAEIDLEHDMVGNGPAMRRVFDFIRRVAPTDSTVLVQGESGTGKELVARAIHRNSNRANAPFVAINCAAITESLLESELFGHEKGAFTGAVAQKRGRMEAADGGTLFLDEIGELALPLQAKLLRVLQEREFERVGGTRAIPLDLRLVAASNRELSAAVESGVFRSDLFYRLNVVRVMLPPVRERREDIEAMANHFVMKASRKSKARPKTFSPEALACMKKYDWPGNVRELENAVEHALVLGSSETIRPEDLPESLAEVSGAEAGASTFHGAMKESKKQLILQALQRADGDYIEAAKSLSIHPNSLLRLIRNLGLKESAKGVSSD